MRFNPPVTAVLAVTALMLAGCAGGATLDGPSAQPAAQAAPAPREFPGRWVLSAPNAPFCGLNFAQPAQFSKEGRVSPEGGCPARFFLARRYSLDGDKLIVSDEGGETLGQLTANADGYSGTAATGERITLNR